MARKIQRYDRISGANNIIHTEHRHIHEGKGFTCSASLLIANSAVMDSIIWAPNSAIAHLRVYELDVAAAPFHITLYEGPFTVVNSGIQCPPMNMNRNSSRVSSLGFSVVGSVTLNNSLSTRLEYHLIHGAKQAGGSVPSATLEWNLKLGTQYLLRTINDGAGTTDVGIFLFYYEEEEE